MSLLLEAHNIVFERTEEKKRQYGPMDQGMREAAQIASLLTRKQITARDMYLCMVALKLSREAHSHKDDNILDACAYLAAMAKYEGE